MLYKKNNTPRLNMELFKNPTAEYRGAPFWAWNCRLDRDELYRQLEILKKMAAKAENNTDLPGVTLAFLGDSVTQGCFELYEPTPGTMETVFEPQSSYASILKKALDLLYPKAGTVVINSGLSGGNAKNGADRFERDVAAYSPDLVTVCFGLNDCGGGTEGLALYKESLASIFDQAKAHGIDCIFMTPNMMNTYISGKIPEGFLKKQAEGPLRLQTEGMLETYLSAARQVAMDKQVAVCDVYAKWKALSEAGVDTTELLSNHTNHPAREMQNLFAISLLSTLFFE